MFILPRRTMQSMLDELDCSLSAQQQGQLATRLNRSGVDRVSAMWELIVLWSLSRVGSVVHEAPLPNGRQPDILFEDRNLTFVADITTVSDAGLHLENAIEPLWQEIIRLATKAGLDGNHFGLSVEGRRVGDYGDEKVHLALPKPSERAAFVKAHVRPFVLRAERLKGPLAQNVDEGGVQLQLSYNPNQWSAHLGHPTYNIVASLQRNPLANCLRSKIGQVRGAAAGSLRGVIACDGGCGVMARGDGAFSQSGFTRRQVANDVLQGTDSLDFVLLLSIASDWSSLERKTSYRWNNELVVSEPALASGRVTRTTAATLAKIFDEALGRIPALTLDPLNASIRCASEAIPDMIGGLEWSDRMVRISSRALMRLLAGDIELSDFRGRYGWLPECEAPSADPFAKAFKDGRLIESVQVEPSEKFDDDWLVIHFGQPDPAAAPFVGKPKKDE